MANKRRPKGSGSIRQLPSGRYQATFNHDGQRAVKTVDTKEAAQGWLNAQVRKATAGDWAPEATEPRATGGPRFSEYAEQWLASRDLKPRTKAHYRKILDTHLLPQWGTYRLTKITPAAVRDWHRDLLPDAPTMRAHIYSLLRTILRTAWEEDLIESNPCRVRGAGRAKRQSRTEIPTAAQVRALADAMPDRKHRVLVLVAAWCGLRFGELTELRPEDFDGDVIKVRRAVALVDGKRVIGDPKSEAGKRDVVIPPHVLKEITDYVATISPGALVFPANRNEGHMASSALMWHWLQAREAAGVPGLRFHDLRHFAGTAHATAGATLAETMAHMGHSTTAAAMVYQHAAANRNREIAERMAALAAE